MFKTIYKLYLKNIVALPIHDSLLVEKHNEKVVRKILNDTFLDMLVIRLF